ncbi:MAG: hypothetical protein IAA97_00085 [Spirochaetes bacterium]|uniref:Uncharacterized protein n=1 Tax=Candidatus Ornithospirochaeta stercoripullorum TaxID=2840899 RepID=A0A9D9H5B2_9SPIO|nr:hypothetical protein [Candidatus Ornithospirochaeta stercoripullorum]
MISFYTVREKGTEAEGVLVVANNIEDAKRTAHKFYMKTLLFTKKPVELEVTGQFSKIISKESLKPYVPKMMNASYYESNGVEIINGKEFYTTFLNRLGIDWSKRITFQVMPEFLLYVKSSNSVFFVIDNQNKTADVFYSLLQSCAFLKSQCMKIFDGTGIKCEVVFISKKRLRCKIDRDAVLYAESMGCHCYTECIPLSVLL